MNVPDDHLRREIALFRYRIIADLLLLPPGSAGIGAMLQAKAEQQHTIPGTQRTRVAAETIRDWLHHYRQGGFDALYPKLRADRGQPRRLPPDVAELLVTIKSEHPAWSVRQVIQSTHDSGQLPDALRLPASTVHRLLSREGLMIKRTDQPLGVDRRRFTFKYAGEMWMSDVMHGPKVDAGRQRHKTYLIAFIDDATRVIPYAAFARGGEHRRLPAGVQAGPDPSRLAAPPYLSTTEANYRSQQLALVCAKLGIALIHARPYQPAGKGKNRALVPHRTQSIPDHLADPPTPPPSRPSIGVCGPTSRVNTTTPRIAAWPTAKRPSISGASPAARWRYLDATVDLDDLFLFEAKRRVMKDRTVSLDGRLYEVDALLVGHTVTLRYDPSVPPTRPLQVVHDGRDAGLATILDAYANTAVKRARPSLADRT